MDTTVLSQKSKLGQFCVSFYGRLLQLENWLQIGELTLEYDSQLQLHPLFDREGVALGIILGVLIDTEQSRVVIGNVCLDVGANDPDLAQEVENQVYRYEQFMRSEKKRKLLQPDLILRFGDQPFTKSLLVALDDWSEIPIIHFSSRRETQDHAMSVTHKIECQPSDQFDLDNIQFNANPDWLSQWMEMDQSANERLNKSIEKTNPLTDGHVFHYLSNRMNNDWNVMLSNSFIPRDMAMFGKSGSNQFVNRGAAGIDGIISTAIGIAISTELPTCCIAGDLAFLHDSNALLSLKKIQHPFIITVINNGGGNIFKMLPVSENKEYFQDYFITPQNIDIQKLAEAHNLPFKKIRSVDEMKSVDPNNISGVQIIEFETDPDESMNLRHTLWET